MEPIERLANAIVIQAVKDYRAALRALKKSPSSYSARSQKEVLEKFFRSEWYLTLTKVDGEMLIEKLREEVMG